MAVRFTWVFQVTTTPDRRDIASPHVGGWTESLWNTAEDPLTVRYLTDFAERRALCLPKQASIVGIRRAIYTIQNNKLIPGGTSGRKVLFPGNPTLEVNLPQDSLQISLTSPVGNTSRYVMRCLPDDQVSGGEYSPSGDFEAHVNRFKDRGLLASHTWEFPGRDLSEPTHSIATIAAGVVTLRTAMTVVADQYVRFLRCVNTEGDAVKGSYRVTNVAGGGKILTVENLPAGTEVKESGKLRLDKMRMCDITGVDFARALVKKIGRPSESYRGRASKR